MKPVWKLSHFIVYFLFLLFISMACGIFSSPTPIATLPAEVDSPFKSQLVGKWKIANGGTWDGAILSFGENGTFSVTGGAQKTETIGTYYFTSDDNIAFKLPDYQGSASLQFNNDSQMSLTVQTSTEPFGVIYSAEKVK